VDLNWEAIGAIGEVFGATAVILTLVYLAVQIRQNTQNGRDSAVLNAISDFAHGTDELNRDPELVRIWFEGRINFQELDQLEKQRFALYLTSAFHRYEIVLYQARRGKLDELAVTGLRSQMRYAFEGPGTREWWRGSRFLFNPEFQEYCDSLVTEIESRTSTQSRAPI